MKVRDKFRVKSKDGKTYTAVVVNINEFREPNMKYLLDMYCDGEYQGELFVGESFFNDNAVTKIEEKAI